MSNRRDLFILVALFVALILFVWLGPGRQQPQNTGGRPTSYASDQKGALALYTWLREIGYDAQRLAYRPFTLNDEDAALIILNPSEPIQRNEAREAMEWVARGGTLILADDTPVVFGAPNELLDELKFDIEVYSSTLTIERASPLQPALDRPATGAAEVRAGRVLRPRRSDYTPLLGQPDALLVAGIAHGRGYVYISSTSYPFTNAGLRDPENAALVLNMVRRVPAGGRIQFDEYHHGYFTPPSTGSVVFSSPWGWAATYAIAAVALYLALSGRRFGRAIPLKEEIARRSSAEYVESMADLFQRGGKRDYILKHYRQAFKRRLARPYGINPQLDDAEFIRELAFARGFDDLRLPALLAQLRKEQVSEAELVRSVAEADTVLAALVRGDMNR